MLPSTSPMREFTHKLNGLRMVIFALFVRELQSRFNDKLGLGWAFFEPFLFIAALAFIRGLISGNNVHGIPIFIFMMIGLMGVQLVTTTMNTVAISISRDKPLYALRQVQPISTLLVAGFLELCIKVGVAVMLGLTLYLMEIEFNPDQPLLLLSMFFVAWIMGVASGAILAIGTEFLPELTKIRQFATRPLFILSAVFFSLQDVPQKYWHLLNWNPILHVNEIARYASYEEYGMYGVSIVFILITAAALSFLMMAIYHITWKRILSQ